MKTVSLVRVGAVAAVFFAAITLADCGGGGGGNPASALPPMQIATQSGPAAGATPAPGPTRMPDCNGPCLVALGDSISAGILVNGAPALDFDHSFPGIAAATMGVSLNDRSAIGATCEQLLSIEVPRAPSNAVDVTLDCGTNDQFDPTQLNAPGAFGVVLAATHAAMPNAKIVVVLLRKRLDVAAWNADELQQAAAIGAQVVDPSVLPASDYPDNIHLNTQGAQDLAALVVAAFAKF